MDQGELGAMKAVFGFFFAVMALFSVGVVLMQPRAATGNQTPLLWVSDDNPDRKQQIALFNQLNPDLKLTLDPGNQGTEKVIVQSIAGVGPDLFDVYGAVNLKAFVISGVAWDVTDELAKRGIDVPRDAWPLAQFSSVYNGRVYGVPTNLASNGIWFNKELFDAAGVSYPQGSWTWEEFIPLAQRLTKRDRNGRPLHFGFLCDWWIWPQFIVNYGGRIYTEDGTRCILDSPEAERGVQLLSDLIYKYRVMPSPVEEAGMATQGGWGSGNTTLFMAGRGAMAMGGRWWLTQLRKVPKLKVGATEAPYGTVRQFIGGGRSTLINAGSPNREAALEFLVYLSEPPYNKLLNEQADGNSGFIRYSGPEYDLNPKFPNEDFHRVWAETLEATIQLPISPFINPQEADRLIGRQLDLVRINQKAVRPALRDAARDVNAAIRKTVREDPSLQKLWLQTQDRLP